MGRIYLFDVDGTLTPAKEKIKESFADTFLKWSSDKEFYIVSGGSFPRIIDQLGRQIINKSSGVFACMGNIFYRQLDQINPSGFDEWQIVYENKFLAPSGLYQKLDKIVEKSEYAIKTGKHHEERTGMVNFSIVGRNATVEQRKQYAEYDKLTNEREGIVEKLKKEYSSLDFAIGGAVSIDIFRTGADKSQIIDRYFDDAIESNEIIFVGDRIPFPGNDCSLATALRQHNNGRAIEVGAWEDTAKLLKTEPFA
tara:strand:- start:32 stop:790 length:759 start_codon:yes stop_codon:yes gene_type:complete